MNKSFFSLSVLVMVLVFGMTAVGCGKSSADDTGRAFVLTDVPAEYNGKHAHLVKRGGEWGEGAIRIGGFQECESVDMLTGMFTLSKISNGRVNIPMWVLTDNGIERYTGNETVDVVILIYNEKSLLPSGIVAPAPAVAIISFEQVTFLNGNITKSYNDGEIETD